MIKGIGNAKIFGPEIQVQTLSSNFALNEYELIYRMANEQILLPNLC